MKIFERIQEDSLFRKKIIVFPVLVILVLAVIEIWTVNRLSTYGDEISRLEQNAAS